MTDATDNFNRASIGTNWTMGINSIVISASTVVKGNSAGADNTGWWNANTFPTDHYSQVTISADQDGGGPSVRHQSGANTFYTLYTNGVVLQIYEVTAGTFAQLGVDYANNTVVNDTIKLDATGSTLTPSLNGTPLATRTDSTITGGAPGLHCSDTAISLDNWLGGPITAVVSLPEVVMRPIGGS